MRNTDLFQLFDILLAVGYHNAVTINVDTLAVYRVKT